MDDATAVVLGWGKEQWQLDLCGADNAKISKTFDGWIDSGRKVRARKARTARAAKAADGSSRDGSSDWDYLESLGFKRHRGRKTGAEQEALANRTS